MARLPPFAHFLLLCSLRRRRERFPCPREQNAMSLKTALRAGRRRADAEPPASLRRLPRVSGFRLGPCPSRAQTWQILEGDLVLGASGCVPYEQTPRPPPRRSQAHSSPSPAILRPRRNHTRQLGRRRGGLRACSAVGWDSPSFSKHFWLKFAFISE